MLNENIRTFRKAKGLSQEELALRLNVVRQTVSKWERGLSVPDSDLLISVSEALGTPVGVLLGEAVPEAAPEDLKAISEKLEAINLRLAGKKAAAQRALHRSCILLCASIAIALILLGRAGSPYLDWNYGDPETAVMGVALHAFEFAFVRIAPFAFIGAVVGAVVTRNRSRR